MVGTLEWNRNFMERLRTRVRSAIGFRSAPYRMGVLALNVFHATRREGLQGLTLLRMRKQHGPEVTLQFRSLHHPITVRPGSDDIDAVVNNVLREEYGQLPQSFAPKLIVDAGAYIGDTSAYFLSRFRSARVISLEPNPESHGRARMNLAAYGERAVLLPNALWDCATTLRMSSGQTGAALSSDGQAAVETITIPEIMSRFGTERIDLLKMDIEGAETTVIRSGVGAWLQHTKLLLLETHGIAIENEVLPVLASAGFECTRHRNVWYCDNTRLA